MQFPGSRKLIMSQYPSQSKAAVIRDTSLRHTWNVSVYSWVVCGTRIRCCLALSWSISSRQYYNRQTTACSSPCSELSGPHSCYEYYCLSQVSGKYYIFTRFLTRLHIC